MHIDLVTLIVDDYDDAIEFFVAGLGFELSQDEPSLTNDGRPKRWVVVRPPGGGGAGLLLAQADGANQRAGVGRQWIGRVGLFLHTEDFAAMHQRLLSVGAPIVDGPRDEVYGRVLVFEDPAGNRWDLLGATG